MWIGEKDEKEYVKVFYEDKPIPAGQKTTDAVIKKEDTADLNQFAQDQMGRDKSSDKYLGYTQLIKAKNTDTDSITFEIKNKAGDGFLELNSGDAAYFEIPKEFKDRVVKKMILTANRVIDDRDETFVSPQVLLLATNDYRVPGVTSYRGRWRNNDYKGRWQIPYVDDGDPDKEIEITGWGKGQHRSFTNTSTADRTQAKWNYA